MNPSALNSLCLALGVLLAGVSSMLAQMQTIDPVGLLNLKAEGTGGGSNPAYSSLQEALVAAMGDNRG
jgi:hypothetical protein